LKWQASRAAGRNVP